MQIQVQIIKVSKVEKKSSKQGSYETLEVTYKDTNNGKVGGKKLVSFGDYKHIFEAAKEWKEDQIVELQLEKIGEYWTWVNILDEPVKEAKKDSVEKTDKPAATKQQWVPDEVRQRLIVRQSCLERAIQFEFENNPAIEDILRTAERFVNWVFEVEGIQTPEAKVEVLAKPKAGRPRKTEAVAEVE